MHSSQFNKYNNYRNRNGGQVHDGAVQTAAFPVIQFAAFLEGVTKVIIYIVEND